MAKCIKCGGSFLTRGRIRLADADICFKCFDALGFDHKIDIYTSKDLAWNEIKDGKAAYYQNKKAAHAKWLEDNPDHAAFFEALDEGSDEDAQDGATEASEADDSDY